MFVTRGGRRFAAVLAVAVVLVGCSGDDSTDPDTDHDAGPDAEPEEAEEPVIETPVLVLADGELPFDQPVRLEVEHGTVVSADVVSSDGEQLDGALGGAGWVSVSNPTPGETYEVSVEATDAAGLEHTLTDSFTVAEVPDDQRLTLSVIRGGGEVVGVGTPIIVKFDQAVTEREAVESAMHVSSAPQVDGAWTWLSAEEAHFRPKEYWPANTSIRVDLELTGVQAADDVWGGRSYNFDIEVGDEQIARVDAATHTFAMTRNGETIATWPTSLGSPDFATRNGTYVVQSKDAEYQMTSCGANITCDESDPEYYDVDTEFAVRLTNSGTFVHAAPWSETAQGEDNVSHGCLNLSVANAETYFETARYGDIVEVVNSTRDAGDLVERRDPGMVDWNLTWEQWLSGSERGEFTTGSL